MFKPSIANLSWLDHLDLRFVIGQIRMNYRKEFLFQYWHIGLAHRLSRYLIESLFRLGSTCEVILLLDVIFMQFLNILRTFYQFQIKLIGLNLSSQIIDILIQQSSIPTVTYKRMNILLKLLHLAPTPYDHTNTILQHLHLNSLQILPPSYLETVIASSKTDCSRPEIVKQIIQQLANSTNQESAIKLLTIIFGLMHNSKYDADQIDLLEEIKTPNLGKGEDIAWLLDLISCCVEYLAKLPSLLQVYHRATAPINTDYSLEVSQTDLYLLLNQLSMLFPALPCSVNTFGRYYRSTSPYFEQFYKVIRTEVLVVYSYMKSIVDRMIREHRLVRYEDLQCFLTSVPDIQLVCDQVEDLVMNKYYKGQAPNRKIYFRQEDILEVQYFLQGERKHARNDQAKTASSDRLGLVAS